MALVIFQIAGFQNSGKTTLSLKVIDKLAKAGLKIATVKHHGHGGKPDVLETKDSGRHISAGAAVSLVEGDGRILIQAEQQEWRLSDEIAILSSFKPDVILIEGHKRERYPKAVILRDESDVELLHTLENIQVVFFRDGAWTDEIDSIGVPAFHLDDDAGLEWVLNFLCTIGENP